MPKRRTKAECKMLCETWQQSGETKIAFCKQNNINKKSFYRWCCKFLNNKVDAAYTQDNIKPTPLKFLPVGNTIPKRSFISERGFLEIALPNGINVKSSFSQDNINNILQELLKWK